MPETLLELIDNLTSRVKIANNVHNKYFFIETWELESVLSGALVAPQEPDGGDTQFLDTGYLAQGQMVISQLGQDAIHCYEPARLMFGADATANHQYCNEDTEEMGEVIQE